MKDITLVLLAAGDSTRFKAPFKKQWIRIGEIPLWQYVAKDLSQKCDFSDIIIVANEKEISYMKKIERNFKYAKGGKLRQNSLANALKNVKSEFVFVSDTARAEISKDLIGRLINECEKFDCVSPFLGVVDTAYLGRNQIDRNDLKLIQTPQISRANLLKKALESNEIFTDDSAAVAFAGGKLGFVEGDEKARKITFTSDLAHFDFTPASGTIFTGNGFDVHVFAKGEFITLGGIKIPCEYSLVGHSDADAAIHALMDAILGACGLGDIGELFPDTDDSFKGIDSKILLQKVVNFVHLLGFKIINADITIIAQKPKISPYKEKMCEILSEILQTSRVNVKASTTEKLGFVGRVEGVAAIASANLGYFDWRKF